MKKKRFLFFFVHPSKYYLFRESINNLKAKGHIVDVAIISKDVLEPLIKNEGWEYVNIFPEGRRSKSTGRLSILFSTGINFFKTIWRLWKLTKGKKYDIFITDDCLSIVGWLKRIPSYMFVDDDLAVVPEAWILFIFANKIITPEETDIEQFMFKRIGYKAYHELAYLHPKYFKPSIEIIDGFNPDRKRFFIIRLVSLTASHDIDKNGIDNNKVDELINLLTEYGNVYISSERELENKYEKYKLKINPSDIAHVLFYADMFIGDSQTMNTEAALLGTPAIRFNDFVGKISTMNEIEFKYNLSYGFKTNDFEGLLKKVQDLLQKNDLKEIWAERRRKLLNDKIDLNEWMIEFFEKAGRI